MSSCRADQAQLRPHESEETGGSLSVNISGGLRGPHGGVDGS